MPTTFSDSFCPIVFVSAKDIVTPSGTGRNERVSAEARSAIQVLSRQSRDRLARAPPSPTS